MVCLLVLPSITLISKNREQRISRVRVVIRRSFQLQLKILELLGAIQINTTGLDKLLALKGWLVICNHPGLLDVLVIMSRLENIQCVVKNKLWANPIVGGVVRAAGYIRNDMNPATFLDRCKQQLAQGENILIFPEGTRSTPGKSIKVLRGLGNLALAAHANIQTLTLECRPAILTKGRPWYCVSPGPAIFILQPGKQFLHADYDNEQPRSIRVRTLMRDIQHYYDEQLTHERTSIRN